MEGLELYYFQFIHFCIYVSRFHILFKPSVFRFTGFNQITTTYSLFTLFSAGEYSLITTAIRLLILSKLSSVSNCSSTSSPIQRSYLRFHVIFFVSALSSEVVRRSYGNWEGAGSNPSHDNFEWKLTWHDILWKRIYNIRIELLCWRDGLLRGWWSLARNFQGYWIGISSQILLFTSWRLVFSVFCANSMPLNDLHDHYTQCFHLSGNIYNRVFNNIHRYVGICLIQWFQH